MILKTEVKTLSAALIAWSLFSLPSKAQVIPDNTLGTENSTVNSTLINNIPSERIDGGAIRGTNLFHSFETFNIEPGLGVYFSNPAIVENIVSRVTGNNPSEIMGTLGILGDANLFLINPNGIIFGSEASLDIKGSFIGSSAGSVIFEGFEFTTENPQAPPLLTINMPLGLGFNDNPGMIVNQSIVSEIVTDENGEILGEDLIGLRVAPEQTLALVGGEISIEGGFVTIGGGRIELGSVAGSNQLGLIPTETGWQLSYEEVLDF